MVSTTAVRTCAVCRYQMKIIFAYTMSDFVNGFELNFGDFAFTKIRHSGHAVDETVKHEADVLFYDFIRLLSQLWRIIMPS